MSAARIFRVASRTRIAARLATVVRRPCRVLSPRTAVNTFATTAARTDKEHDPHDPHHEESFEEFTARWLEVLHETPLTQLGWKGFALTWHRYEKEFDAVQDHFELQRNLNNAFAYDLVPSPTVISAALRAARRVNDFPTAVRIFEGIKAKVENTAQYDEYVKELEPLREELGVSLKETLYPDAPK
ncbi:Serine/threonine-protein phosphatase [Venturia nashicola]|uniref:Cytochrome c oxidase subunit 6, mitochondrial n=1 Tax=Venturia nashicola TaxID=86259 RepID=A0A4Z1P250_9PEZI|nr:Serine/threonine-protein phosphatase [Venturia nashicola]